MSRREKTKKRFQRCARKSKRKKNRRKRNCRRQDDGSNLSEYETTDKLSPTSNGIQQWFSCQWSKFRSAVSHGRQKQQNQSAKPREQAANISRQSEIQQLHSQLRQQKVAHRAKRQEIDRELTAARSTIREMNKELERATSTVRKKEEELTRTKSTVKENDKQNKEKDERLAERDQQLAQVYERLASTETALERSMAEREAMRRQLDNDDAESEDAERMCEHFDSDKETSPEKLMLMAQLTEQLRVQIRGKRDIAKTVRALYALNLGDGKAPREAYEAEHWCENSCRSVSGVTDLLSPVLTDVSDGTDVDSRVRQQWKDVAVSGELCAPAAV